VERVTGIGGFFFAARDPDALGAWYRDVLGVDPPPPSYDDPVWVQEAGPTVFAPHASGDLAQPTFTVNFRVRDLDAMVQQVRAAGASVEIDPEVYPNGRFAATADPEGNPIQLWEPAPGAGE
jgi:glyoxylase I family protein